MRKLDVFNHIYPKPYFDLMMRLAPAFKDIGKRMRNIPMLVDLDERFRVMDRFEEYQQILSIATPPIEVFSSGADSIELARAANDGMAELVGEVPRAIPGLRRVVAARRRRCRDARDRAGGARSRRARHPDLLEHQRQAARPPRIPGVVRSDGRIRSAGWLHPFRGADVSDYASESKVAV